MPTAGGKGLNVARVASKNGTTTEILEKGPQISIHDRQAFIDKYNEIIKRSKIVTLSGSLPKGLEVKSAVGSGDSFIAGCASSLDKKEGYIDSLVNAMALRCIPY